VETNRALPIVMTALAIAHVAACATGAHAPTAAPRTPTFDFAAPDGTRVFVRRWADVQGTPKGVVQIAHGAAEHSGRYDRFARALNASGYVVYANDHRGHGKTLVRSMKLGDGGPDAWNHYVEDERQLTLLIRDENPGLPVVFFGHSMGSFIAQDYAARYGKAADGVVLCGTSGVFNDADPVVAVLDQAAQADPLGPSKIFGQIFASFNEPFNPGRPGFDWLSRDPAEVQKYTSDPLNGFAFNNELARDFLKGLRDLFRPDREARIPKDLPILVIAGDQDPVGGNTKAILPLLERYKGYGLTRVTVKFYPGARHELLNETNRDEVQADVVAWLDSLRAR